MKKKKSHAFGKDIYLLGIDCDGQNVWLEAPSWDCGWYWGFGYVERYTNNRSPENSKDIRGHTHVDCEFKKDGAINMNKGLDETTYTKEEGKRLSDLFTQFYSLKEGAGEHENAVLIPNVTGEIIQILTP